MDWPCDKSCLTCNGLAENNCLTCRDGFYLNSDNRCSFCHVNCPTCNGPTNHNCLSCPSNT